VAEDEETATARYNIARIVSTQLMLKSPVRTRRHDDGRPRRILFVCTKSIAGGGRLHAMAPMAAARKKKVRAFVNRSERSCFAARLARM
jgi:hypothetical protein